MGNFLDKAGLIKLKTILSAKFASKVDLHPGVQSGKFLQTDSHGDAVWGDAASAATVASSVQSWLENNIQSGNSPMVIDSSLSTQGAAADAKAVGDADYAINQTLATKAPIDSPNFTGTAKQNGYDLATEDYVDTSVDRILTGLQGIGLDIENGNLVIHPVTT